MPNVLPSIGKISNFRCVGIHAGLKANNKLDLAMIVSGRDCVASGVFTQNHFVGAPVTVTREHIQAATERIRAVVINTKTANAATGRSGLENSRIMARLVAEQVECDPEQVLVMSTGVIGEHLPMEKIDVGITKAYSALGSDQWEQAADAIRTTDTRPKLASINVMTINGHYTIAGIVKGSGMIAPNMATMLSVIVTDVKLTATQAQESLKAAADTSYNRIVVDGDTSPNDMVLLLANGSSGISLDSDTDRQQFQQALNQLSMYLAQQVVRDGEGVTKFVTLDITGAPDDAAANRVGQIIAASPLVKTAFFGNDANWGRIIAAAGRAGVDFDVDATSLWISSGTELYEGDRGLLLFDKGTKARYNDDDANAIIAEDEIYVSLDLGSGDGSAVLWTCDLSHDYVDINAEYRT